MPMPLTLALSGAALGFSLAAPVGPMGLLCINRTLNAGLRAGLATGAGASTVHVVYAGVLMLGLGGIGPWMGGHRAAFSLVGAALSLVFAFRALGRRRRALAEGPDDAPALGMSYLTAIGLGAVNPMLFLLLLGAMAALIQPGEMGLAGVGLMLGGLAFGSFGWWVGLSAATATLRGRLGPRALTLLDRLTGAILLGFGARAAMMALG